VHGETGVHVPPRDPARVAAAACELLADPARRERMGDAGARRMRRRYSWDRIAEQTLEAYAPVLPQRGEVRQEAEA
jgi:glycosyltransferase involved in cell wall biosynthesis